MSVIILSNDYGPNLPLHDQVIEPGVGKMADSEVHYLFLIRCRGEKTIPVV